MITKERLEELIKQEATIWVKNQYCNAYDVELSHCDYVAITDNKESLMFLDYSIQEDDPESVLVDYLENLYETKEDAEWASIATYRTEIFDPPAWEEINDDTNWECFFFTRDGYDYYFVVDGLMESISLRSEYGKKYYFDFTKEDYIKACTIARKLFLGESVDEI